MKKLLPQANNLDVVVKVFIFVGNCDGECTTEDIADFIGYEPRQAAYYLNACYYLSLVDDCGLLTPVGQDIMRSGNIQQRVYERIITDDLINKIFARIILFPEITKDEVEHYAYDIIKERYETYSESVLVRRSQCLVGWCYEIKNTVFPMLT